MFCLEYFIHYLCRILNITIHVCNPCYRYRLQLTVEDHTGIANLVLFDKEASSLVGRSCTEMVEVTEKVINYNNLIFNLAVYLIAYYNLVFIVYC